MHKKLLIHLLLIPTLFILIPFTAISQFVNYNINTGKSYAVVPFQMYNDFIVIPIKLDGKLPLNFILDTGASSTIVIHKEYTDLVGAIYERQLYIQGADRSQKISALLTQGIDIELPEVTAKKQHLLVLENDYIEFDKYSGTRIDGILGMDLFKRFIVRIDYESRLIYLFDPNKHDYNTSKYENVDIISENDKMYLQSQTQISNEQYDVKWLVDSGAAMTVLVQCQESDTTFIPQNAVPGNIGKGLGGYIEGYLAKFDEVQLGDYPFNQIIGNFQQLADSVYIPQDSIIDGLLGNKILKQFHIVFDYMNRKIHIRPNRFYNNTNIKDLSGISITASGVNLNQFTIEEVFPGSPAEKAGLKAGDVIKKINGKNTFILALQNLERRLNSEEGKRIKLTVKRDTEKIKTIFYLEDYL